MLLIKRKNVNLNLLNFLFSTVASLAGTVLFCLFFPNLQETLKSLTGYLGSLIIFGIFIVLLVLVYAVTQILIFFILSRNSIGLTYRHFKNLVKKSSPLHWINLVVLIILLVSLVWLCLQIESKSNIDLKAKEALRFIAAVFAGFGVILTLTIYCLTEFWYKNWAVKKEEHLSTALANTSGLMVWDNKDNKDDLVRDNLYSLRDCDFIFIWAIHFSTIIGKDNENSLLELNHLLSANSKGIIYVLLQCPFCEAVIERSIELDYPYNENYILAPIESISNCLAQRSEDMKVALRHGTPYFRTILWGKKKDPKNDNYDPLSSANNVPSPSSLDTMEERFLSQTEHGGFIVQEYPRGIHGSQAPLIKGSLSVHGGMWNSIRLKFAQEFLNGIRLQEQYEQDSQEALRCLALDLGIDKKKAISSTIENLTELVQKKKEWDDFIRRINDAAKTKSGLLANIISKSKHEVDIKYHTKKSEKISESIEEEARADQKAGEQ